MKDLPSFIKSQYGIIATSIYPAKGGFSTKAAYHVASADGMEYFVKVYDNNSPTTRFYVERIELYMPVLDWLSTISALQDRILTPVKTLKGAYKTESHNDVYTVFLYVNGEVPGIQGMTQKQTVELAEILALLHDLGKTVPYVSAGTSEDVSMPFCDQLVRYLNISNGKDDKLSTFITPYADILISATRKALHLRDTVRIGYSPIVLCHGDAHGNNIIQGKQLVLADWEDLRLAPAEADLFIHAWHKHSDIFLSAYTAARRGYVINKELLHFYILRRRIEDVWVDIHRLTEESPSKTETAELLDWIAEGITEVHKLL